MKFFAFLFLIIISLSCATTKGTAQKSAAINTLTPLITGAEQTEKYLPYLKGKRVAILANQTSIIGKTHLL